MAEQWGKRVRRVQQDHDYSDGTKRKTRNWGAMSRQHWDKATEDDRRTGFRVAKPKRKKRKGK